MTRLILSKKRGISALSGELELPIMEILWAKGPLLGRDLYGEIRREKTIAYTTALTVLDRLSKKGFLRKDKNSGKIVFSPRISREDYRGQVTDRLVELAFEISPDLAVSAFADHFSGLPDEAREKIEKLIRGKEDGRRN